MTKSHSLSVVIPCWNSLAQLKANLPAVLEAARQVDAEVIVVDDASRKDDSVAFLRTFPSLKLLCNAQNLGFSATVNRGVSAATGDLVALLNTDVAPDPACFENVLKYFSDPTVFAVTFNSGEGWARGEWSRGLFHHFGLTKSPLPRTPVPSLFASGGQAAFARDKWQALGGFDLLYHPFYWEDVDLSYRAYQRGWQVLWAPDALCHHYHDSSVIAESFARPLVAQIALRNQLLFIWKNIHSPKFLLEHLLRLPQLLWRYPRSVLTALPRLPSALRARRHAVLKRSDESILALWKNAS